MAALFSCGRQGVALASLLLHQLLHDGGQVPRHDVYAAPGFYWRFVEYASHGLLKQFIFLHTLSVLCILRNPNILTIQHIYQTLENYVASNHTEDRKSPSLQFRTVVSEKE
jgi:hypothetical protein